MDCCPLEYYCYEKGRKYDPDIINGYAQKSMGIDPGFGSSAFGVVVTQFLDGQIPIMYAEEYQRPDFNQMLIYTIRYLLTFHLSIKLCLEIARCC
jgi:hypothetical protein